MLVAGLLLICLVVILGFKSAQNTAFVVWFGLASALIAPVGISCISSIFNIGNNRMLEKLLKVSQIDELIKQANSQEDKIKTLEEQRKNLTLIVKYETLKHAAIEKKGILSMKQNTSSMSMKRLMQKSKDCNWREMKKG